MVLQNSGETGLRHNGSLKNQCFLILLITNIHLNNANFDLTDIYLNAK